MPKCYRCKQEKTPEEFMKKFECARNIYILMGVCQECHFTPREMSFDSVLKGRISMQNRRAQAVGLRGDLTLEQWKGKLEQSEGRCFHCSNHVGIEKLVIEHLIPVALGGHTTAENIVPACRQCNFEKGDRTVEGWKKSLLTS